MDHDSVAARLLRRRQLAECAWRLLYAQADFVRLLNTMTAVDGPDAIPETVAQWRGPLRCWWNRCVGLGARVQERDPELMAELIASAEPPDDDA